ncbi:unnamed protein product [Lactuca saligna]|uniref:Uncharacterized protein n=1 Tax=Lactuca saligna TaxID=75948 RepID=A0AA36DZ75_LACSI|nr:unnamed protein product [Lactuca saligna]
MLNVVNKGPIATLHQASKTGAVGSKLKGKFVSCYNKVEKRMLSLDVKDRIAMGNSFPLSVYYSVQNCLTSKEMMIILSFAFEKEICSDDEVKCLMAQTVESHANTSHGSIMILDDDSSTTNNLKPKRDDASTFQGKEHIWYLDSGCSRHMIGFKSLL